MTEVQIRVQFPDQVESIEQLEAVIDAKGQQIKQQLFEPQLASSAPSTKDQIRTYFLCPAAAEGPTLWSIIPAEQWLPGRFEGFSRSQY